MFKKKITRVNVLILTLFVLDRILKRISFLKFGLEREHSYDLFLFKFSFYQNKNIALSIPLKTWIYYVLFAFLSIWLIKNLVRFYKEQNLQIFLGTELIVVGAISNLIDRIKNGFIIDYIETIFSVFNLADVLIVAGIVILIISLIWPKKTAR